MRFSAVILFLVFATNMLAQPVRFSNFYNMDGAGGFEDLQVLGESGLVAVGSSINLNIQSGFYQGFHLVADPLGNELGAAALNVTNSSVQTLAVLQSVYTGQLYTAGYLCDYTIAGAEDCDLYFTRFNPIFQDTVYAHRIGNTNTAEILECMVETRPNKFMLGGWTFSDSTSTDTDILLVTIDSTGNELNRVVFGGEGNDYISAGCRFDESGNAIYTGYTQSFDGGNGKTWAVKTDSIGNILWHQVYQGLSLQVDAGAAITRLADGSFVIGGHSISPNETNGFLLKIDTLGNQLWSNQYSLDGQQGVFSVIELADGSLVATGESTETEDASYGGWLIKTDTIGKLEWSRVYNPTFGTDHLRDVEQLSNGDFIMAGLGRGISPTIQVGWIIRVDSLGCLVEGCDEPSSVQNQSMDFFRFYPNPAKDRITIESRVPIEHLLLRDVTGRTLQAFDLEQSQNFQADINVDDLPSGIYLLEARTISGKRSVQKVVLE